MNPKDYAAYLAEQLKDPEFRKAYEQAQADAEQAVKRPLALWTVEGPYSIKGGGRCLAISAGPLTVATVGFNEGDDLEACRADADLIAAAPEMLHLLRVLAAGERRTQESGDAGSYDLEDVEGLLEAEALIRRIGG